MINHTTPDKFVDRRLIDGGGFNVLKNDMSGLAWLARSN